MNMMNMPGFTAEHSLRRSGEHFHTGVSDTLRVFNAEVRPQLMCQLHGNNLICGDEPFGGGPNLGGDHTTAQCRSRCYLTKRGAALKACVAEC